MLFKKHFRYLYLLCFLRNNIYDICVLHVFLKITFTTFMSYMFFLKKTFTIFVSAMFLKLKIHSEANLVIGFLKKHVRVLARTWS